MAQTAARGAETVEWLKCDADAAYFLDSYGWIDDPQGDGASATVRFRLWPAQVQTMWQLMLHRLIVILKARQLGISWLCCGYALWLCLFRPGRSVLCFSKGQQEANELIRRIRVLYDRLPDWLRSQLPALTRPLTSELEWANGSRIVSLPATENAGRSFTASLVLMDEAAFSQWAGKLYTALKPTIDAGGQLIVFSTANGADPFFQPLWEKATAGVGGFTPIFLPWHVRPGRDAAWYARTEAEALSSAAMKQEYPATAQEAFAMTGAERFLADMTLWDACADDLPPYDGQAPMVLAADASISGDTFALVGVTAHPSRPGHAAVRYVMPFQPPGGGLWLDYTPIEQTIARLTRDWNVVQMAFDPYQMVSIAQRAEAGLLRTEQGEPSRPIWVDPFNQGPLRLEADKSLWDSVIARRVWHDGNPALREHISNADKQIDAQERKLRIVKRAGHQRIDLAVALSMGHYRLMYELGELHNG